MEQEQYIKERNTAEHRWTWCLFWVLGASVRNSFWIAAVRAGAAGAATPRLGGAAAAEPGRASQGSWARFLCRRKAEMRLPAQSWNRALTLHGFVHNFILPGDLCLQPSPSEGWICLWEALHLPPGSYSLDRDQSSPQTTVPSSHSLTSWVTHREKPRLQGSSSSASVRKPITYTSVQALVAQ